MLFTLVTYVHMFSASLVLSQPLFHTFHQLLAIPKALELAAVALHPPATEEALGSSGPPPTYSLRILVPPLLLTYPWVIFMNGCDRAVLAVCLFIYLIYLIYLIYHYY